MTTRSNTVVVGTILGNTSAAIFFGANLGISFVTIPTLLLLPPPSPLPAPVTAENKTSPRSISSQKPHTQAHHLARQWQCMYDIMKKAGPVFALLASGSWLYTARQLPTGLGLQRRLLWAAAGLTVAIVPFTFSVMKQTNDELHRRADSSASAEESETDASAAGSTVESYQTHDLLRWWAKLNLMRALLHVGAISCATTALLL